MIKIELNSLLNGISQQFYLHKKFKLSAHLLSQKALKMFDYPVQFQFKTIYKANVYRRAFRSANL